VTPNIFGPDLALVHHLGFGFHADACAPDLLRLLEPVSGLVLELGCGSGALTRHLVAAGHRVVATDASPAMVELTRANVPGVVDARVLVLPDDPLPRADAVVSVGHVLNYLPSKEAVEAALVAIADALEPGGLLAIDLCDLEYGEARIDAPNLGRVADDWAMVTRFSRPSRDHFVRDIATFTRSSDGTWRRDDERHDNVLLDTSGVPPLLARHGVEATIATAFGSETLPVGLRTVVGRRVR